MTDAQRRPAAALSGAPRTAVAALLAAVAVVAGCGPSVVAPTAGSSAISTATSTAAPASRAPSPSASVDPATAAIDGFVDLVTKKGFSYQATFTGQSRHTTAILPVSKGLLQVSGDNVLVRATFKFPTGERYPVEHRSVGGKAWIRYLATEGWQRIKLAPTESMAAFAGVRGVSDVTYLGPIKTAGTTWYKVAIRSAIVHPVMIPASNLSETILTSPKLTILLDAAGRPVKGTAEIDGRGRISGQLQEIVIDLTITFRKVGEAVTIKAP